MSIPIVIVNDNEVNRYLVKRAVKSLDIDSSTIEFEDGSEFIDVFCG